MSPVGGWAICVWATARPTFGGVNTFAAGVEALLEVSTQRFGSSRDISYETKAHQMSNGPIFATALLRSIVSRVGIVVAGPVIG